MKYVKDSHILFQAATTFPLLREVRGNPYTTTSFCTTNSDMTNIGRDNSSWSWMRLTSSSVVSKQSKATLCSSTDFARQTNYARNVAKRLILSAKPHTRCAQELLSLMDCLFRNEHKINKCARGKTHELSTYLALPLREAKHADKNIRNKTGSCRISGFPSVSSHLHKGRAHWRRAEGKGGKPLHDLWQMHIHGVRKLHWIMVRTNSTQSPTGLHSCDLKDLQGKA